MGLGDLGHRVAESLSNQGHSVLGIRRSSVSRAYATLATDIFAEDLAAQELSCLCLVYAVSADDRSPQGYQKAYPNGLEQATSNIKTDRVIFVGSSRIYGQQTADWIDENTDPQPSDWAGKTLLDAERHLNSGDCALILGGIYGPDRDRMLRLGKQGAWCQPGHLTNRIHIVDAARLCVVLALKALSDQPLPRRVLGVDGEGADMAEVLDWCRQAQGVAVVPDQELHPPQGKKCHSVLFQQLGFSCTYPSFRDGYQALIAQEDTP